MILNGVNVTAWCACYCMTECCEWQVLNGVNDTEQCKRFFASWTCNILHNNSESLENELPLIFTTSQVYPCQPPSREAGMGGGVDLRYSEAMAVSDVWLQAGVSLTLVSAQVTRKLRLLITLITDVEFQCTPVFVCALASATNESATLIWNQEFIVITVHYAFVKL